MSHHKHYTDAVALLAQLHGTTPDIIRHAERDTDTAEGVQLHHDIAVVCRFAEALFERGARAKKS
jgi:hypothetical protein